MSMLDPRRLFLVAVIALAACAGVSADWVKADASEEQIRADNAQCRAEADAVVGRESDITHDIRVGSGPSPSDSRELLEQTRDIGVADRYDRIFGRCMRALGYTHRKS